MTPILLTLSPFRVFLIALIPSSIIAALYLLLFRKYFVNFYRNWRSSKAVTRMPDLYLGSRPQRLRDLAIGQSGTVSKSAVYVDKKGRIWLRADELLSDSELTYYSAWHLVHIERTGENSWALTLPISADENLPRFEPSNVHWSIERYLPVTEVRELQIKPKLETEK